MEISGGVSSCTPVAAVALSTEAGAGASVGGELASCAIAAGAMSAVDRSSMTPNLSGVAMKYPLGLDCVMAGCDDKRRIPHKAMFG